MTTPSSSSLLPSPKWPPPWRTTPLTPAPKQRPSSSPPQATRDHWEAEVVEEEEEKEVEKDPDNPWDDPWEAWSDGGEEKEKKEEKKEKEEEDEYERLIVENSSPATQEETDAYWTAHAAYFGCLHTLPPRVDQSPTDIPLPSPRGGDQSPTDIPLPPHSPLPPTSPISPSPPTVVEKPEAPVVSEEVQEPAPPLTLPSGHTLAAMTPVVPERSRPLPAGPIPPPRPLPAGPLPPPRPLPAVPYGNRHPRPGRMGMFPLARRLRLDSQLRRSGLDLSTTPTLHGDLADWPTAS